MRHVLQRAALLGGLTCMLLSGASQARVASADDPYRYLQWGLEMIKAPEAWSHSKGAGAVIAILDTGIDRDHPDLASKMTDRVFDPCRNQGLEPTDDHGTHVAGIAAAVAQNSRGIAGVAPNARIMDVKILGGGCWGRNFASGIRFAVDNGADVINASVAYREHQTLQTGLGVSDGVRDVRRALRYARGRGVVVVGAAGNSRLPFCAEPWHKSPVLCVGAVNSRGSTAAYSNFDATQASNFVVAPGGEPGVCESSIISTIRSDQNPNVRCALTLETGYGPMGGTSMAAPHVSGVAALLASQGLTAGEIVRCILDSARDIGPSGRDPIYGNGLVDALAAVTGCS